MEDLDFGFAHSLHSNYQIEDQFIFVYQYRYVENKELTIYSVKNQAEPVVKYSQPPLYYIEYAFVVKDNSDR